MDLVGLILILLSNKMFIFLLSLTIIAATFVIGFYSGIKNANSSKIAKIKEIEERLKK
jgi:hypothetical protein